MNETRMEITKIYIGERIDLIWGREILYIVNSTSDFRIIRKSIKNLKFGGKDSKDKLKIIIYIYENRTIIIIISITMYQFVQRRHVREGGACIQERLNYYS